MTIAFVLICHIIACLWVFFATFADDFKGTWMEEEFQYMSAGDQYLTSFYFTVTTITTVGYGDISGSTSLEQVFCIVLMVIGVVGFGLLSGALTNILQNYDV